MSSLYELTGNYLAVLNADEMDEQTMIDTLDSIKGEITDKAQNIVKMVRMWESDAEIIKAEEQRLQARRKALEHRVERIKQYVQEQMERIGTDKIKTPTMTVAIQKNPPSLEIVNPQVIPNAFLDYIPATTKPNSQAIKEALKAGVEVPGARLTQGRSLRIR